MVCEQGTYNNAQLTKQKARAFLSHAIALTSILVFGSQLIGCQNISGRSPDDQKTSSPFSGSSSTAGTNPVVANQCQIFADNSKDYSYCVSCSNSLGSSATLTQIIQCVHENASGNTGGGNCSIPSCGAGQIVDLVNCVCKDATSPNPFEPGVPGVGDSLTPYVRTGFSISDRYCARGSTDSSSTTTPECLQDPPLNNPAHTNQAPVNVFQDLGYLRWDLSLDASQYDVNSALLDSIAFRGTNSTLVGNSYFYYQLKPNTAVNSSSGTINWRDCAEHFSGVGVYMSSNNACSDRTAPNTSAPAATASTLMTSLDNSSTGSASIKYLSMNGSAANKNITDFATAGNSAVAYGIGLAQRGDPPTAGNFATSGAGLFSNIGSYKYTWGPLAVKRPTGTVDVASAMVSGRVSLNVNLGYTPVAAIESTAFSPDAQLGSVTTRTCSTSVNGTSQCVVTVLYRGSGGSILYQNFSPRYLNNGASAIGSLPTGITAVSTPQVIEDTSQIPYNTTGGNRIPARLRAFVRAEDGNIYMSRGEKGIWNPWINLGRPYACDTGNSTLCATENGVNGTLAQVYKPFNIAPDTLGLNDGISIVGEPVVVSYMDGTANNPIKGYIAVFVRVSHLNSSTGTPGTYHNAVFYTMAATDSALPSSSDDLDFDNPSIWSRWMPVRDAAGNIFAIQGKPLAMINERNGTDTRVYLFGTESAATRLHPPVAPENLPAGTDVPEGYFNYGTRLIRTSLDISAYDETSFTGAIAHTFANAISTWSTLGAGWVGETACGGAQCQIIVGDWTYADIDDDTIRVFAPQIVQMSDVSAAPASESPKSYTREIRFFEYDFTDAGSGLTSTCAPDAAGGSSGDATGGGYYSHLRFLGTPHALNLGKHHVEHPNQQFTGASAKNRAAACANPINEPAFANGGLFLFGRTTCTDKTKCDTVNPVAAYATVSSAAHCSGTVGGGCTDGGACPAGVGGGGDVSGGNIQTMYYPTYSVSEAAGTSSSYLKLRSFYTTSDVIPVTSNALSMALSDFSVFLFTRNSTGRLTHGYWGSYGSAGTAANECGTGTSMFTFIPSGAFTN